MATFKYFFCLGNSRTFPSVFSPNEFPFDLWKTIFRFAFQNNLTLPFRAFIFSNDHFFLRVLRHYFPEILELRLNVYASLNYKGEKEQALKTMEWLTNQNFQPQDPLADVDRCVEFNNPLLLEKFLSLFPKTDTTINFFQERYSTRSPFFRSIEKSLYKSDISCFQTFAKFHYTPEDWVWGFVLQKGYGKAFEYALSQNWSFQFSNLRDGLIQHGNFQWFKLFYEKNKTTPPEKRGFLDNQWPIKDHLMCACYYERYQFAEDLVLSGICKVTPQTDFDRTLLGISIDHFVPPPIPFLEFLVKKGESIDKVTSCARHTLLHIAVLRKHNDIIRWLLKKKASIKKDSKSRTPLDLALYLGHHDQVAILKNK